MLPQILIWICALTLLIALSVTTFKMVKLFLRRRKFVKKPLETTSQILSLQRASVPSSKVSDPGLQPGTKLKEMHAEENIVTRNQGDISSKSSSSSPWDTCTSCFSTLDFDESNSSTTGTCQDTNLQNLEFGNDMVWKSSYKLKMLQINPRPDILKPLSPGTENVSLQGRSNDMLKDEVRRYVHNWINMPDTKRSESKTFCASAVIGQPAKEQSFEDNFEVDRLVGKKAEDEAPQQVELSLKKRKAPIHISEAKRKAKVSLESSHLSEDDKDCNDA